LSQHSSRIILSFTVYVLFNCGIGSTN
jgi:hypothetical protein